MYCLKPIPITDALLTSSTVPDVDTGETAWVSGTTYAATDVRTYNKRKYERLVGGAGTTAPDADANNWLDVGSTNKWAMFDNLRSTGTSKTGPMTVVITPAQRITALALMRLETTSVSVTVVASGETVYSTTRSTLDRSPTTWSTYFFGSFRYQSNLLIFDLPPYAGAVVTITFNNTIINALATCGACIIGTPVFVGKAVHTAISTALNFSTVERDTFGNVTLIPRRSVPRTNQVTWVDKALVNSLIDLRTDINAVPCVWSGLDDKSTDSYFDAVLILGIYEEFQIELANAYSAKVTLQLQEV